MKNLVLGVALCALMSAAPATAGDPTCYNFAGVTGWANHGQHIVGDYVTGDGSVGYEWPPEGVGQSVSANGGAALPGGPGPGAHFGASAPPGASFCVENAKSGEALYGDD
ncbi:hypothetical protein [Sphingomicrobium nitratireducens]|uniref:hypothetical protein n=1 Tax=Sphingomicrobium nitratireducens TaxID=2964666 RepID=UPI002240913A|nr:hypothetical protein [Sphingomicrobium nitratireducens]